MNLVTRRPLTANCPDPYPFYSLATKDSFRGSQKFQLDMSVYVTAIEIAILGLNFQFILNQIPQVGHQVPTLQQ